MAAERSSDTPAADYEHTCFNEPAARWPHKGAFRASMCRAGSAQICQVVHTEVDT